MAECATTSPSERVGAYQREVQRLLTDHPEQRAGQAYFNVLRDPAYGAFDPAAAAEVAGTALDTFNHDDRIPDLMTFLEHRWSGHHPVPVCPHCGHTLG